MPGKSEPDSKLELKPKLRFPEFHDEWDYESLGELAERITARNADAKQSRVLTNSAEFGILDQRDYFEREIVTTGNLDNYFVVQKGDYVYNPRVSTIAPVGPISKNFLDTGVMSPLYTVFRFNSSANDFYAHFFKSSRWHDYLRKVSNSGARHDRMSITNDDFMAMPVPAPDPAEQEKIASCLSSLDELIAEETQKLEALEAHKKGLMQQFFPREGETIPRLRFPEFKDAPAWETATIQELMDRDLILGHLDGNHGSLYPRSEEFSKTGVPYITANDFKDGYVSFEECKHLPMERALQFKKGVAKDGDILFAHNATVGPVAKLVTDREFVILSTTATYFRCDLGRLLNNFLRFALCSQAFVNQYTPIMSQSTRNQVPITAQRMLFLSFPEPSEQNRIAEFLTSLDDSVVAQAQKLVSLQSHKKGLMQQLFPSMEDAYA